MLKSTDFLTFDVSESLKIKMRKINADAGNPAFSRIQFSPDFFFKRLAEREIWVREVLIQRGEFEKGFLLVSEDWAKATSERAFVR